MLLNDEKALAIKEFNRIENRLQAFLLMLMAGRDEAAGEIFEDIVDSMDGLGKLLDHIFVTELENYEAINGEYEHIEKPIH
jgi:hypothetical protein